MADEATARKGPVDGAGRVLRELIRTPRFKQAVQALLSELDPESAGALVRVLMWEDPGFFLSVLGSTPSVANTGIEAAKEAGVQLAGFPPPLLSGFLAGLLDQVNARALGESLGCVAAIVTRVSQVRDTALREAAASFRDGFRQGLSGAETAAGISSGDTRRLVDGIADGIRGLSRENSAFFREVLLPLVEAGRDAVAGVEEAGAETGEEN